MTTVYPADIKTNNNLVYYAEFTQDVIGHEYAIYNKFDDVMFMNGWCETEEKIDNVKKMTDALNKVTYWKSPNSQESMAWLSQNPNNKVLVETDQGEYFVVFASELEFIHDRIHMSYPCMPVKKWTALSYYNKPMD